MKSLFLTIFILASFFQAQAASQPMQISGQNVLSKEISSWKTDSLSQKGLVVVFLSAKCPCSHSHVAELKSLHEKYKSFEFVGIHSNTDEAEEFTKDYFQKAQLPFTVIQDPNAKLADQLKAYKTPHVFVFNKQGEIAYQGGVSDSNKFDHSEKKFLREALEDLDSGHAVRTASSRSLGCAISRGEQNVW